MTEPGSKSPFAVLLFTDIFSSAELKRRHGVPAYSVALRVHNDHFERMARGHRGLRILKSLGDGYLAEAGGVAEAVRFALRIQDAMRTEPWGGISTGIRFPAGPNKSTLSRPEEVLLNGAGGHRLCRSDDRGSGRWRRETAGHGARAGVT